MINLLSLKVSQAISIGPLHVKALERLDIQTLRDLIFYVPRSYKTKTLYPDLRISSPGDRVIIKARLAMEPKKLNNRVVMAFRSQAYLIEVIYFRKIHPFLKAKLKIGQEYLLEGDISKQGQSLQIIHPEFLFSESEIVPIEPLYNLTYGLTNKKLHHYIRKGLFFVKIFLEKIPEYSPIAQMHGLPCIYSCLETIHQPKRLNSYIEDVSTAIKRLATDELIAHQICLRAMQIKTKSTSYQKNEDLQNQALKTLGFNLTQSQLSALAEIEKDQSQNTQMVRLLQGDVGSGKTVVALLSMLNVIGKGQAALMVPTELLAIQHYKYFCRALLDTKIICCLLSGNMPLKEKNATLKMIQNQASIIIGTHALFQEKVQFSNLQYIVIDEQHRFGVIQRLALMEKANVADLLLMTATPIPRSLAMTMLGNISISQMVKSQHHAKITTLVMKDSRETEIYLAIQKIINKGEKIYWICPFVENNEELNNPISNVESRFDKIKAAFGENQVAMMHGGTDALEREKIMHNFSKGEINILVATTIVEVGIDVSNATLIVIENAERFGLAQLHQLRGRVGRSNLESYCILFYSHFRVSNTALQRLNFMKSCNDGFLIAEEDLKLRGSGDVLGIKQSGSEDFYFVDKIQIPQQYYQEIIESAKSILSENPAHTFYTEVISKKHAIKSKTNT
jgi:ATP-dependent DNA helicase RecG